MGMFDWVTVHADLPNGDRERHWQTKSLPEPNLREYTVTRGEQMLDGQVVDFTGDVVLCDVNDDVTVMTEYVLELWNGAVQGIRHDVRIIGDSTNDIVTDLRDAAARE